MIEKDTEEEAEATEKELCCDEVEDALFEWEKHLKTYDGKSRDVHRIMIPAHPCGGKMQHGPAQGKSRCGL